MRRAAPQHSCWTRSPEPESPERIERQMPMETAPGSAKKLGSKRYSIVSGASTAGSLDLFGAFFGEW